MAWAWFALLVPAITVVLGVVVMWRARRRGRNPGGYNEAAGTVFQAVGALYAVLLAFIVVNEWNSLQEASTNTFEEANHLGALYWDARALPPEVGRDLEATTQQYARVVVAKEWPLLGDGGYSPEATALVYRMRDEINALPTDSPRTQLVFEHSLATVNDLAAARRERLSQSGHNVPTVLWIAMAVGAVVTVGFTFFFGLPKFWTQLLLVGALAVLVVLSLGLIMMLDQPFVGSIAVQPEAFEIFLRGLPAQR
ncbi:bestrophin-like domain [Nocardia thraciensis]